MQYLQVSQMFSKWTTLLTPANPPNPHLTGSSDTSPSVVAGAGPVALPKRLLGSLRVVLLTQQKQRRTEKNLSLKWAKATDHDKIWQTCTWADLNKFYRICWHNSLETSNMSAVNETESDVEWIPKQAKQQALEQAAQNPKNAGLDLGQLCLITWWFLRYVALRWGCAAQLLGRATLCQRHTALLRGRATHFCWKILLGRLALLWRSNTINTLWLVTSLGKKLFWTLWQWLLESFIILLFWLLVTLDFICLWVQWNIHLVFLYECLGLFLHRLRLGARQQRQRSVTIGITVCPPALASLRRLWRGSPVTWWSGGGS